MLKARGLNGLEQLIDHQIDHINSFTKNVATRTGFLLVPLQEFKHLNVTFWYIPSKIRSLNKTDEWWQEVYKVAPAIKEKMIRSNGLSMIGYQPLSSKNIGNFFRMTFSCFPPMSEASIEALLSDIERFGEEIYK